MKIAIILGTRPEIIKMSPIIRECEKIGLNYFILHTGQHYSFEMDKVFFNQLELPIPNYNLDVGSGNHGEQTGKMLIGIERILMTENPDVILVLGDITTVLAGTLAAVKLGIKVGHVEAGLRSYDRSMPEEINRILSDHISDFLFAPTEGAMEILRNEGLPENRLFLTYNTIVDAVYQNKNIACGKSDIINKLDLKPKEYFLVTAHRQENVDAEERIIGIIEGLRLVSETFSIPIVFPIHPRTLKKLKEFGLNFPDCVQVIDPVGFLDFLQLEINAKLIITDSGGIQEESCILKVPCITLRDNTERPETLDVGSNLLVSTNPTLILEGIIAMLNKDNNWTNPFGDGKSGEKIIEIIRRELE